jgi:Fic family protein
MHIEIRVQGKRKKYYLAHSFRRDGKVKKIRFYLGLNLSKEELKTKRERAEKNLMERIEKSKLIRDPFYTALSPSEIEELKALEARGEIKILHLNEKDWLKFTKLFTYDTNAIEGSTVTVSEVGDILEKSKWPEKRTKWEISETYGVAEAIKHIRKTKEHISLNIIKELHKIVFGNSKSFAGSFREMVTEVAVVDALGNIVHKGAPSDQIAKLLNELIRWYDKNKNKYPALILAAVVHNHFETIHPFRDGNGRVGRLLLNNILLKHNLPPVNIELKNRREYYSALQEYQKNKNIRPMVELILKEYKLLKKILKKG